MKDKDYQSIAEAILKKLLSSDDLGAEEVETLERQLTSIETLRENKRRGSHSA